MVRASSSVVMWPDAATPAELNGIRLGSNEAAIGLLQRWEPLIAASANRRTVCPASRDEAAQAGRLAVLGAAVRFDPSRGTPFNHYAARAVRNETSKTVQQLSSPQAREIAIGQRPIVVLGSTVEQRYLIKDWLNSLPTAAAGPVHARDARFRREGLRWRFGPLANPCQGQPWGRYRCRRWWPPLWRLRSAVCRSLRA